MSLCNLFSHSAFKKGVAGLKFIYSYNLEVLLYHQVYESKIEHCL